MSLVNGGPTASRRRFRRGLGAGFRPIEGEVAALSGIAVARRPALAGLAALATLAGLTAELAAQGVSEGALQRLSGRRRLGGAGEKIG
jgi:hypothetical protein